MTFVPFLLGIVFIFIHLTANYFIPAGRIQQIKWFSFSGGLATSYVFIYLLPTLHTEQQNIETRFLNLAMDSEIYIIGLLGVVMLMAVQISIHQNYVSDESSFWLTIGFYAVYNALVSFTILSSEVYGLQALFYGFAIGLHFLAVAHDMWREFREPYERYGRYILAAGILVGWILALTTDLSALTKSIIFAFVSGAMIYNVFINEIPKEKDTHFPSFLIAVVFYSMIAISLKLFFEWY
ncbi:hypothetical protein [Salisediminibacterium selenitireducens]|uniref:Uncharacterized protein n=1 Tax=Bacillus selenitireducens (strain ATCC 700615 / DSM 15326 / MLS10) TaxID=439292 RepID=D6XSC7_BACIE|nr:hypothetical protein [Salisediminibacterium selenitireducens]ADH98713.1 conserved hypothetical protein [[Bacillus] selenitireducens MLS10]